jgi:hypothetical protein
MVEDDEDGYRIEPWSVGEYFIAEDRKGRADTAYRELTLTVRQLIEEFGEDAVSPSTKAAADNERWDEPVACVHAIEPDGDGMNPYGTSPDTPWRSVYYEISDSEDKVLAVRGYERFPVLVWRYGKLPGSPYGYGRGHDVLPHLVRLRKQIYRYGQGMAEMADPSVQIPAGMQQHEVKLLPGGKTFLNGQGKIENSRRVELRLKELEEDIEKTRQQIRDTLGSTLVASLRHITHQMTAHEAAIRTNQALTEWLPGLYRLHEEMLSPYVEWLWDIAAQRGMLPVPPAALDSVDTIDIEFTSPLARKQRQGEADAIVRAYAVAGEIAKVRPDVLDNLDVDKAIRKIAEIEGAPVESLKTVREVMELREAQRRQLMAQQQAEAAQQAADIAKTGAEAQSMTAVA